MLFLYLDGGSYSSQLLARVLFNFHALSSREISVRKGDIVIIHRPVNHHWVEVEDSQSGLKVSIYHPSSLIFPCLGKSKARMREAEKNLKLSKNKSTLEKNRTFFPLFYLNDNN